MMVMLTLLASQTVTSTLASGECLVRWTSASWTSSGRTEEHEYLQ